MIRIALISDTHGLLRAEVIDFLRGSDRIVHAGDVCDAQALERLSQLAPLTAVRGNNDEGVWAEELPRSELLRVEGITVHVLHDLTQLDIDPLTAGVRVVVSGHSHKPSIVERDGVLYVNPGSAGPRRFKLPIAAAPAAPAAQPAREHVLRDVFVPGLRVVFCGTAAGAESARRGAYYAGPGNAFWRTLHEVGLTPRCLRPEEYPDMTGFGLGLTDLAKYVSGADATLERAHFEAADLRAKIAWFRPRILAFTSKRAAAEFVGAPTPYGRLGQECDIGETVLFVLPSPSGAARGHWSVEPWRELARLAQGPRLR